MGSKKVPSSSSDDVDSSGTRRPCRPTSAMAMPCPPVRMTRPQFEPASFGSFTSMAAVSTSASMEFAPTAPDCSSTLAQTDGGRSGVHFGDACAVGGVAALPDDDGLFRDHALHRLDVALVVGGLAADALHIGCEHFHVFTLADVFHPVGGVDRGGVAQAHAAPGADAMRSVSQLGEEAVVRAAG